MGNRTSDSSFRPVSLALTLAIVVGGCAIMRPPPTPSSDGFLTTDRDPSVSIHLGPKALQVALPLLLARSSPTAPLYLRHLDEVVVSVYESDGDDLPLLDRDSDFILRIRDKTSTVWLVRPNPAAPLDRFYLLVDDGDEQIVAYARGNLTRLVQQAFATSF